MIVKVNKQLQRTLNNIWNVYSSDVAESSHDVAESSDDEAVAAQSHHEAGEAGADERHSQTKKKNQRTTQATQATQERNLKLGQQDRKLGQQDRNRDTTTPDRIDFKLFRDMCLHNLQVELSQVEELSPYIVEQAVINAVKPIEVVGANTKDPNIITHQKKIAKANVVQNKSIIIQQHVDDIKSKINGIEKYAMRLTRDMKLGSGSDGLSRRAFLERYLVARADIMNEEEKLESKKYDEGR